MQPISACRQVRTGPNSCVHYQKYVDQVENVLFTCKVFLANENSPFPLLHGENVPDMTEYFYDHFMLKRGFRNLLQKDVQVNRYVV